jgi:hypothetical protein
MQLLLKLRFSALRLSSSLRLSGSLRFSLSGSPLSGSPVFSDSLSGSPLSGFPVLSG